ncbi:MAG: MBOAT family protein [Clostridia bacterium]|nr:MBOAT family protein [Clostridia bacterium]
MLFSSITFLYYFLPCVLIVYFLVPKQLKNVWLLLTSLFFYAWGEPKCVFLMLATILTNYIFGILIEKAQSKKLKKAYLTISVLATLSGLLYFKYANFFVENFAAITGISTPVLNIALPIGISFYTFQILSYTIDVYRGEVSAQKNPLTLGTYVALFPQLVAGPIVRYKDVERELNFRTHSFENIALGIRRFILGLGKKVIIANTLGELAEAFYLTNDVSVMFYWLFAIGYMLQIYFDFSGYSDMAIGLGKIFGFDFLENFNYPFISKSITEFWRRWHISLGSWFRDYVYFPLGGSRVGKLRLLLNLFIVWFLTGFWHGAAWNFVLWGLFFFVFLSLEKLCFKDILKKSKLLGHIYTLLLVTVSFAIFSGNNLTEALARVGGLFGAGRIPFVSFEWAYQLKNYAVVLIIAIIGATPLPKMAVSYLKSKKHLCTVIDALEIFVLLAILVAVTAFLADGSFNPFLYFRF